MTTPREFVESQFSRGPDSLPSGRSPVGPLNTPPRERSARRPAEATEAEACENVLAKNAKFTGTIVVDDSLRLEGEFKGEVRTQATLYVVPEAVVEAKVQAAYAVIGGNFKGEVQCEQRVDLLSSCRAQGKLVTNGLSVESGALFDGNVEMTRKSRTTPTE